MSCRYECQVLRQRRITGGRIIAVTAAHRICIQCSNNPNYDLRSEFRLSCHPGSPVGHSKLDSDHKHRLQPVHTHEQQRHFSDRSLCHLPPPGHPVRARVASPAMLMRVGSHFSPWPLRHQTPRRFLFHVQPTKTTQVEDPDIT